MKEISVVFFWTSLSIPRLKGAVSLKPHLQVPLVFSNLEKGEMESFLFLPFFPLGGDVARGLFRKEAIVSFKGDLGMFRNLHSI